MTPNSRATQSGRATLAGLVPSVLNTAHLPYGLRGQRYYHPNRWDRYGVSEWTRAVEVWAR